MTEQPRKAVRWLGYLSGFFLALFTVGLGYLIWGFYFGAEKFNLGQEKKLFDNSAILKHLDAFLADQEILAKSGLFLPTVQTWDPSKDAGQILNPKFPWMREVEENKEQVVNLPQIVIPAEIEKKLLDWKDDWLKRSQDVNFSQLDFSWMERLQDFTYWDLESNSPRSSFFDQDPYETTFYPFPNMVQLKMWARLRLMKGIGEKNSLKAFKVVRHLGRLLLTTEDLLSSVYAISLFSAEREAFNYLKKTGRAPKNWKPISKIMTDRLRRTLFGWSLFSWTLPEFRLKQIVRDPERKVGYCRGINFGLREAIHNRVFLGDRYPERFAALDSVLNNEASFCRVSHWKAIWKNPDFIPQMYRGRLLPFKGTSWMKRESTLQLNLARLFPPFKHAIGLILSTIAKPDPMKYYEQGSTVK